MLNEDFMNVAAQLIRALEAEHIQSRIVPVGHIAELKDRLEHDRSDHILPEPVDRTCFTGIEYDPEKFLPGAKSIIVAAIPSPRVRNTFYWNGQPHHILIPPVYSGNLARLENFKSILKKILTPHGYTFVSAPVTRKPLAVCSDLAEYGRNNICYVPGMGSFVQLASMYTDLPSPGDFWRAPVMMSSCEDCSACRESCPTNAINDNLFAIASDRCLTFFNENEDPFADWINPKWFDCLVGCLQCQDICPANASYLQYAIEGETFTEEETACLLSFPTPENVPPKIKAKLERLDMFYMEVIPRNLTALLKL
jgi:epoxyqueuosine reductase